MERAFEYPDKGRIPTGIIYRTESVPAYEEQLAALDAGPLVSQPLRIRPLEEYGPLLKGYM